MSKSEQIGGGGGGGTETTPRKEPKPKQKRPWIKPRVRLVEFSITKGADFAGVRVFVENQPGTFGGINAGGYDPNIS